MTGKMTFHNSINVGRQFDKLISLSFKKLLA